MSELLKNLEHRLDLAMIANSDMIGLLRLMYRTAMDDTCGAACEILADWMDEHGYLDETGELKDG